MDELFIIEYQASTWVDRWEMNPVNAGFLVEFDEECCILLGIVFCCVLLVLGLVDCCG